MREEGRGERESEGKKDKGKLLDKHKHGRALCLSVCHMRVYVFVCACLSVCFIMYDVSMYVQNVCAYIKGKGECRVRRKRVGGVNNSTSSRSTLPSLAVFPHCKSQIDYSNSKTKLARPLGHKPK